MLFPAQAVQDQREKKTTSDTSVRALRGSFVMDVVFYKGQTQINLNLHEVILAAIQSWMKEIAQGFLLW